MATSTRKKKLFLKNLKTVKGIIASACDLTGIARQTYYNWIAGDEKFKEECEQISDYVIDLVETSLLKNINAGDTTAIIFYLKTKGKARGYIEQIDTRHIDNPWVELAKKSLGVDGR